MIERDRQTFEVEPGTTLEALPRESPWLATHVPPQNSVVWLGLQRQSFYINRSQDPAPGCLFDLPFSL
jgi:hypothetical protein